MKKAIMFLKFIATGSLALMLTACYGVMYGVPYKVVNGKVTVKNTEGEPIPGLKIEILDADSRYEVVPAKTTNAEGIVQYSIDSSDMNEWYDYIIFVEDVDGSENNGFYGSKETIIEPDYEASVFDANVVIEEIL